MTDIRYITTSGHSGFYKKWNDWSGTRESLYDFLVKKLLRVYDADECGSRKLFVRLYETRVPSVHMFRKITYNWYIETDPEWEIVDGFEVEAVNGSEIDEFYREYLTGDRDWILV